MGTQTPIIRPATLQDAANIEKLEKECFPDPWNLAMVEAELKYNLSHYIILEADRIFTGYAGIWLVYDEAQVNRIAVAPSQRNLGWGNYITKRLIEMSRNLGARSITLEVRTNNQPAVKAYLKSGFVSEGIRPRYYEDGTDALIMWIRKL